MGRPKEEPPEGFMMLQEAAELLGVSPNTVKNWYRDGKLDGKDWITEAGQPRYIVSKESVQEYVPSDIARVEMGVEVSTQLLQRLAGELKAEIRQQRKEVTKKLDETNRLLSALVRYMEEDVTSARPQRERIDRVLGAIEKKFEIEAEGERKSWWKRFFD